MIQVILREKIRHLGSLGDVVKVKPGFARNFLIPQGKASRATAANVELFEVQRVELEKIENERLAKAKEAAQHIAALVVTIKAKSGEGGKLFGSVGSRDIAEAILKKGVSVERHQIRLPQGVIRQIGEYAVGVHLHFDVEASFKVIIEAE